MSHVDEGTLHAYLDGELPSTERAALEAHLAQCASCRATLTEERALLERASALLGSAGRRRSTRFAAPDARHGRSARRSHGRRPSHSRWVSDTISGIPAPGRFHPRPRRTSLSPTIARSPRPLRLQVKRGPRLRLDRSKRVASPRRQPMRWHQTETRRVGSNPGARVWLPSRRVCNCATTRPDPRRSRGNARRIRSWRTKPSSRRTLVARWYPGDWSRPNGR